MATGPRRYDWLIMREDYYGPVGFAREPAEQRKRWIARIVLAGFVLFIVWLFVTKVINPPQDSGTSPGVRSSELPGPR